MIQQNDVLHWQCSDDTPFMLQLLYNHLHLEHLSSVYLYGTQDLHRAFLTLSDSQFLLLTSHPKTPNPLLPLLFSSVLLNVGFGLPLCLFLFGFQVNATLQSLFWSCLRMCPTIFHHLYSILFITQCLHSCSVKQLPFCDMVFPSDEQGSSVV